MFEDTTALNQEHYVDVGYVHAAISVWDRSDILDCTVDPHP